MKSRASAGYPYALYLPLILGVVFVSGLTALVYQVLWLRELRLLFGNTAYAASTTLAVFFLGLSVGGYFWGKRAPRYRNNLFVYSLLEFGTSLSALIHFVVLDAYYLIYSPIFNALGHNLALSVAVKFVLAVGLLFLPAFFMGGTFPVMGQHLIRRPELLGRIATSLYALNTLGAAAGAFAAGFYLPLLLGFDGAYVLAVVLNLLLGVGTLLLSRRKEAAAPSVAVAAPATSAERKRADSGAGRKAIKLPGGVRMVWPAAFFSGFLALALEVLWTRMFSLVLQNSVYTYSAVLITFLAALGIGSLVAHFLCRLRWNPRNVLSGLLTLSGLLVGLTPFLFYAATDGLRYLAAGEVWPGYIVSIFSTVGGVLLIPTILLGSVFPYLLRILQEAGSPPGRTIGYLGAVNTVGAIAGAVLAGFVFLNLFGLWGSIRLAAVAYLGLALLTVMGSGRSPALLRAAPLAVLLLFVTFLDSTRLSVIRLNPVRGERLVELWEGSHGIVAVVERPSGLSIRVNNYYTLGGTSSMENERNQALIPLMTHPDPRSVFFLGLGTGITAGASLSFPVERVVVCELVPDVVRAAARYFNPYAQGLFTDERVEIVVEDGRNYLLGTRERFDAVISDLFIPWKAGTGNLYTVEHYRTVLERLNEGGIFAQWLPLYQVSDKEFRIIARSMLEVFPRVVLWRGDFFPHRPIVALIGQRDPAPLDPQVLIRNGRYLGRGGDLPEEYLKAVMLPFYVGNLTQARHLFEGVAINRDRLPLIEYQAPITHREQRSEEVSWFHSMQLVDFYDDLLGAALPHIDPYLSNLSPEEIDYVIGGLSYYKAAVLRRENREAEAEAHFQDFLARVPVRTLPPTEGAEAYQDFGE